MSSSTGRNSLPSYTRAARPNSQGKRYAGQNLAPAASPAYHAAAGAAPRGRRGVSAAVTPTQSSLGAGKSPPKLPAFPSPPTVSDARRAASQPASAACRPPWRVGWSRHQLASQPAGRAAGDRKTRQTDTLAHGKAWRLLCTVCHPGPEALSARTQHTPCMWLRFMDAVL